MAAILATLIAIAWSSAASAQPVTIKHWSALPGWEVRVAALRGTDMGAEPRLSVVAGRDAYIYLVGAFDEYRMLDLAGHYDRIADIWPCQGYSGASSIDLTSSVPRVVCGSGLRVAIVTSVGRTYVDVPRPRTAPVVPDQAFYPGPSVEFVGSAPGGYWFVYAYDQGVGRVLPSGRVMIGGLPRLEGYVTAFAAGNDLYLADRSCRFVHVRGRLEVVESELTPCASQTEDITFAAAPGDGVWEADFQRRTVYLRSSHGRPQSWTSALSPLKIVVAADHTAYVFGMIERWRYGLLIIRNGHVSSIMRLPIRLFSDATFDARGRLWIADALDHAVIVASPPHR